MGPEAVIVVGACVGLLLLGFFLRPESVAYLFVALYLLFPKFLNVSFSGHSFQVERALELGLAAALVIAMITHYPEERPPLSRAARVVLGIGLLLVAAFAAHAVLRVGAMTGPVVTRIPARLPGAAFPTPAFSEVPVHVPAYRQLFFLLLPAYGLLFFYLGVRFFRSPEKLEGLFKVVILCVLVGTVEGLVVPPLGIAPGLENPGHWHFIQAGLTLGGRDFVTRSLLLCFVAVAYFLDRPGTNKSALLLVLPIFAAALITSVQLAAWAAVAIALAVYLYLRRGVRANIRVRKKTIVLLGGGALLAAAFFVGAGVSTRLFNEDVFSWHYRLALWSFLVDWFRWSFPFGLGAGAVPYYFAQSSIGRFSSGHNLVLEFIAEFGLLGLIGLVACGWMLIRNYVLWRRDVSQDQRQEKSALLGGAVYSILVGELLLMQIDSTVRMYFLYMLLLASTESLSRIAQMAQTSPVNGRRRELVTPRLQALELGRFLFSRLGSRLERVRLVPAGSSDHGSHPVEASSAVETAEVNSHSPDTPSEMASRKLPMA